MIIAIDFDGTIVSHQYPEIGSPVPGAIKWMEKFRGAGAKLILWTMRCDSESAGPVLTQAVEYCRKNGIEFWGVNKNPKQGSWTKSAKAYANIYIDDAAFGCPLLESPRQGERCYVDWDIVGPQVMKIVSATRQRGNVLISPTQLPRN